MNTYKLFTFNIVMCHVYGAVYVDMDQIVKYVRNFDDAFVMQIILLLYVIIVSTKSIKW